MSSPGRITQVDSRWRGGPSQEIPAEFCGGIPKLETKRPGFLPAHVHGIGLLFEHVNLLLCTDLLQDFWPHGHTYFPEVCFAENPHLSA